MYLSSNVIAAGITLEDSFTDHRSAEELALHHLLGDEDVHRVLRGLDPREAAVAAYWAQGAGTWSEAAGVADLSTAYGDRVRRKLRRLGERHTQRAPAAADVTR
ncbi:hypothetical protein ACFRAR_16605 [Kitasatospora sp. NPDC056651]|uniref:hypothetical protein n=1 Tax=Kitasatospora sp. NPDC056651 TaxID=3345892 RepID=UPI0036B3935C